MSVAATQQDSAPRAHLSAAVERCETPTIKGLAGAHDYIHRGLQVPAVTRRALRDAAERREVEVFLIGGAYWFSEQGLYDWVMSLRQGGVRR